jgi:hypothetical protein
VKYLLIPVDEVMKGMKSGQYWRPVRGPIVRLVQPSKFMPTTSSSVGSHMTISCPCERSSCTWSRFLRHPPPPDVNVMEVKQNDADLVDAVVHASDGEGAVHLSEIPVQPLFQFLGRRDQAGGSRLGVVAEDVAGGGAPERASQRGDTGRGHDLLDVLDLSGDGPLPGPGEGFVGVDAVADREGDDDVVVAAVVLAAGARLLEGDDDGGNPVGEVVAGVAREADLVVGEGVGDDVVGAGAEVDEAAGGRKDGDLLAAGGRVGHELPVRRGEDGVEGAVGDATMRHVVEEAREGLGAGRRGLRHPLVVGGDEEWDVNDVEQALGVGHGWLGARVRVR